MNTDTQLEKRTHVYVMQPAAYEISGCKCGNTDPDWSEFKGRLWCEKCQIDFVPERGGIFDGPIPVNGMRLMGISLDKVDLDTGEVISVEQELKSRLGLGETVA